jgi:hypothetical protein
MGGEHVDLTDKHDNLNDYHLYYTKE